MTFRFQGGSFWRHELASSRPEGPGTVEVWGRRASLHVALCDLQRPLLSTSLHSRNPPYDPKGGIIVSLLLMEKLRPD